MENEERKKTRKIFDYLQRFIDNEVLLKQEQPRIWSRGKNIKSKDKDWDLSYFGFCSDCCDYNQWIICYLRENIDDIKVYDYVEN